MSALLARVLSLIGVDLIKSLLSFFVDKFNEWKRAAADKKASEEKNREAREASEKSTTPEEREDAARKTIGNY